MHICNIRLPNYTDSKMNKVYWAFFNVARAALIFRALCCFATLALNRPKSLRLRFSARSDFLGPCCLRPLSVDIVFDVLLTNTTSTCTTGCFDYDISDVHILVAEHLAWHSMYGVLTQCASVVNNVCDDDKFA